MITMNQLKAGVQRYLESEFIPVLSGLQKWVFGAGAALLMNRLDTVISAIAQHPMGKMLNIIHGDKIDIDAIYEAVHTQAAAAPVSFDIPGIGTFKMGAADVDNLYKMIVEG